MSNRTEVLPYGFVSLVGTPDRKPPRQHHRFDGQSGRLTCRLTVKTPLFTYNSQFARLARFAGRGHEEARFPVRRDGIAVIPGSSLKGVIRSVAEAVEASCFTLFDGPHYTGSGITRGQSVRAYLPDGFRKCDDVKRLCPACRIFGFLRGGDVHAGKVNIGDATAPEDDFTLMDKVVLDVLSTPKPEGAPQDYIERERGRSLVEGRKFYRHRLDGIQTRAGGEQDHMNKTVQPVAPESEFTFNVAYDDLRHEELELLLYALVLEDGLWHKIGLGKPLGLGSVKIDVTEWEIIDREARYRSLGAGIDEPLTGNALAEEIASYVRRFRESQADNLSDLRELWRYEHKYDVQY